MEAGRRAGLKKSPMRISASLMTYPSALSSAADSMNFCCGPTGWEGDQGPEGDWRIPTSQVNSLAVGIGLADLERWDPGSIRAVAAAATQRANDNREAAHNQAATIQSLEWQGVSRAGA